jgi:hypothetical protein
MSLSRLLAATMIAGAPASADEAAANSPTSPSRAVDDKARPTTGSARAMAPTGTRGGG